MQGWVHLTNLSIRNHSIDKFLIQLCNKLYNKRNHSTDITKPIIDQQTLQQQQTVQQPSKDKLKNLIDLKKVKKEFSKKFVISIDPITSELPKKQLVAVSQATLNKDATSDIVRLRKVLPRDAQNVIKLFQKSFSKCEPIANCLGLPEPPLFCPILKEFWINSIRQGMTYAAIPSNSVSTDYLYGAVLNTRLTQLEPDHWWLYSKCSNCPKTKSLLNLWSFLVKDSAIHQICATKKILNIAHIIINEEESKKLNPKFDHLNLAKVLIAKSFRIAESKGYKMASLICSSDTMCQVANQLKMEKIYDKSYKKFFESKFQIGLKNVLPNLSFKIFTKKI